MTNELSSSSPGHKMESTLYADACAKMTNQDTPTKDVKLLINISTQITHHKKWHHTQHPKQNGSSPNDVKNGQ